MSLALDLVTRELENSRLQQQETARPVAATPVSDLYVAPNAITVLDRSTSQPVQVSPDEVQKGVRDGRYALDPTQSYQVLDDKGQPQQVAGRELFRALDKGWSLDSEDRALGRQEEARVGAIRSEEAQAPWTTFGRTLANEVLFGVPEHLMSPEAQERFRIGQEANPVAAGLGTAAGYATDVGLAIGTGGLSAATKGAAKLAGKVAPKVAARVAEGVARREIIPSLVKGAARGAVESAVIDVPRAVSEAALGDPEEAAEGLAMSVGLGSIVGGLLGGAGAVVRKGADAVLSKASGVPVRSADDVGRAVGELSDRQAVQMAGGKKVSEAVGLDQKAHAQFLRDEGLLRKVGEEDAAYATRLKEAAKLRTEASRAPFVELDSTVDRSLRPSPESLLRGTSGKQKEAIEGALKDVLFDERATVKGLGLGQDRRLSLASLAEAQEKLLAESAAASKPEAKAALEAAAARIDEAFAKVSPEVAASRASALKSARLAQASSDAFDRVVKDGSNRTLAGDVFDLVGRARGLGRIGIAGAIDPSLMLPAAAKHLFDRAGGLQAFQVALAARGAGTRGLSKEAMKELQRQVYGGSSVLALADASVTHGRRLLQDGFSGATRSSMNAASPVIARVLNTKDEREPRRRALEEGQRVIEAADALSTGAPLSTQSLLEQEAPGLSQAHRAHVQRSLQYLADKAPRSRTDVIDGDTLPTLKEARSFELRLNAAFDPDRAANDIRRGRGRPEQVETLQALYPRQWSRVQQDMLAKSVSTPEAKRAKSQVLGAPRQAFLQRRKFTDDVMGWDKQQQGPQQKEAGQQAPQQQAFNVPQSPARSSLETSPADRTALRSQLS